MGTRCPSSEKWLAADGKKYAASKLLHRVLLDATTRIFDVLAKANHRISVPVNATMMTIAVYVR